MLQTCLQLSQPARLRRLLILLLALASTPCQASDLDDCNGPDATRQIVGCSAMISAGTLQGQSLALAHSLRSDGYSASGDWSRVVADRAKAVELDPSDSDFKKRLALALVQRGTAFSSAGKLDLALNDLVEALRVDPGNVNALAARSAMRYVQNNIDGAIDDLKQARTLESAPAAALATRLAALLDIRGGQRLIKSEFAPALADYTEALAIAPHDARLHFGRGLVQSKSGDVGAAIVSWSEALRLDPNLIDAYLRRGDAYQTTGVSRKAIADFSEAVTRDPKSSSALIMRGIAYEDQDERENALADYKNALMMDPSNEVARRRVARLTGRPVEAVAPAKSAESDDIVRSLQQALKTVGCDPGSVDGKWGDKGKTALSAFSKYAKIPLANDLPSQEVLDAVSRKRDRVCPLSCDDDEIEKDGRCVAKPVTTRAPPDQSKAHKREASPQKPRPDALRRDPPPGSLQTGQVVTVDDGSCPRGQIKQLTGGGNLNYGTNTPRAGPPRISRCVAR